MQSMARAGYRLIMENFKKLEWPIAVAVIIILILTYYSWGIKKSLDGDYYVAYYGHCSNLVGNERPVFGEKFVQVLNDKVVEIGGKPDLESSALISDAGRVTVNLVSGEKNFYIFTRATDGDYYYIQEKWENAAGCHGIGAGEQINKYPSLKKPASSYY